MIVPMKKATIVVQAKDADSAVGALRGLGVLHVEHQEAPKGRDISMLEDDIGLIDTVLAVLLEKEFARDPWVGETQEKGDWRVTVRHIIDLRKRLEQSEEFSRTLISRISQWEPWGDFEPHEIEKLAEKGVFIRLYQIPVKEINNLPEEVSVHIVHAAGGLANCVIVSRARIDIPYKEIALPKMGLDKMRRRLVEDERVIELIKDDIHKLVSFRDSLCATRNSRENELEFQRALKGMGQAGTLSYLTGYFPAESEEALSEATKKNKWGLVVSEPGGEDNVPTLIRNPRWVSLIEPVFRLLGVVPGYRELDISPIFLCFLSLFFGMIIGDAGYGAVYFLLAFWLHRKFARKLSDTRIFFLLYVFSACAIFWGLLTGTVFGQEWYLKAGHQPFIPLLNNTKFLQTFCFFLGAVHLTLAHAWQGLRKAPSLTALSDAGWIGVLWAGFFLARTLILDDPFPFFGKWLIVAGLSLVIFCTSPQRNIFKTIASGLGTVALSLMNNFTDIVSYIRLFAVGLAGVAIADTVNALAAGFAGKMFPVQMLILFAGHTINIILGPMSVLVHGIRLNVLEFSSHAGLSWSGMAYRPLKE